MNFLKWSVLNGRDDSSLVSREDVCQEREVHLRVTRYDETRLVELDVAIDQL